MSIVNAIIQDMAVKDEKEWMLQAESDISAAETLFQGGKYIYAVFECHLSVEKALKAYYFLRYNKEPPKTHDLIFLVKTNSLAIPDDLYRFIGKHMILSFS